MHAVTYNLKILWPKYFSWCWQAEKGIPTCVPKSKNEPKDKERKHKKSKDKAKDRKKHRHHPKDSSSDKNKDKCRIGNQDSGIEHKQQDKVWTEFLFFFYFFYFCHSIILWPILLFFLDGNSFFLVRNFGLRLAEEWTLFCAHLLILGTCYLLELGRTVEAWLKPSWLLNYKIVNFFVLCDSHNLDLI